MKKVLLAAALPVLLLMTPLILVGAVLAAPSSSSTCSGVAPASLTSLHLTSEEVTNATTITNIAVPAGGSQAAVVAIAAALTESGLRTNPGVNGGSYGIFQQTPSAGWGTVAQVTDVTYATTAFVAHLVKVHGWQTMAVWAADQAVQGSGAGDPTSSYYKQHHLTWGYGGNYKRFAPEAQQIVTALAGSAPSLASSNTSGCGSAPTGSGTSNFTANTQYAYVGKYTPAQLYQRARAIVDDNRTANADPYFHSVSAPNYWYRDCQGFVGVLEGMAKSGYYSAGSAWSTFLKNGTAHPAGTADGMSPPPGAWLYYSTGDPSGHVTVYLGGGLVAGTDTWGNGTVGIGPASDITNGTWHLTYLGWAPPKQG